MALLNTAKKVYTGATAATKVYLGDTVVWPPPIPAGPTAVRSEWTSATVNTVKWTDSVEAGVTYEVYVSPTLLDDMTQGTRIATGIGAGVGTYTHTKSAPEQLESILYYAVFSKKGLGFSYPELASTPRVRGDATWAPITIAPKSDKVQALYHIPAGGPMNTSMVMTGGNSTVDWGDGTAPTNHANGSTASHDYVYSAMPAAGEIAAGRQAMATISPQDGNTLTGFALPSPIPPTIPTNKTPDTAYLIGKGTGDVTVSVQTDSSWNGYPGGNMPVAWFKLVPAATGSYNIFDNGADDSYGFLFNTTPVGPNYTNYYLQDDDSGPGSGFQFSAVTLTAGVTYWIAASFYDYGRPPTNGKLDVTIQGGALVGGTVYPTLVNPVEVSVASETIKTLGVNAAGTTRLNLVSKMAVPDATAMFYNHTRLVSICGDVSSGSTSMSSMFDGCSALALFPRMDVAGITNFSTMFSNCAALTSANIPTFLTTGAGTGNGTNFSYTFMGCNNVGFTSVPLIDTSKGTNFSGMFYGCNKLTSVPALNTGLGTDFSYMFNGCSVLATAPITSVSNGTTFSYMFNGCVALTTANIPAALTTGGGTGKGLSFDKMFQGCGNVGFTSVPLIDTSKGTNFSGMFYACGKLTSVPALNTALGTNFSRMFYNCTVLPTMPITSVGNGTDLSYMFYGCSALTTANIPAVLTSGWGTVSGTDFSGMFSYCDNVGFTTIPLINTANGTNFGSMFDSCLKLTSVPALNTGLGTNFSNMFYNCAVLTTAPITSVSNGTTFSYMFRGCSALTTANIPAALTTGGGTGNGLSFEGMFQACNNVGFTTIPLIDTSKGTNFSYMFYSCAKLTSVPALNTSLGTTFSYMFNGCTVLPTMPITSVSNGTNFSYMFYGCVALTTANIPAALTTGGGTSKGTNFSYMFRGCNNVGFTSVPLINTALGTNFSYMFYSCTKLTSVPALNTGLGTNFSNMFCNCTVLPTMPITSVSNGTNFRSMFSTCYALTTANIPAALTAGVGTGNGTDFTSMFDYCTNVGFTTIPLIDTSKGTNFGSMFYGSNKLTSVPALNTALGTNFGWMFNGCAVLTTAPITSVSNGTDFSYMFSSCAAMTTANLPAALTTGGGTSKGTDFSYMFEYCSNVGFTSMPALNTSKGTDFSNMFYACNKLTSVPALNTALGIYFGYMFYNCSALATAPAMNCSVGTTFGGMFGGCTAMTSVLITGARYSISISTCAASMPTANINTFYTNLGTAAGAQTVTVTALTNQAASTKSIATAKGWTVA